MVGHLFNHFVFAARISERTKWAVFAGAVSIIVGVFWWFRGIAFGITGPMGDAWGLGWRQVCFCFTLAEMGTNSRGVDVESLLDLGTLQNIVGLCSRDVYVLVPAQNVYHTFFVRV